MQDLPKIVISSADSDREEAVEILDEFERNHKHDISASLITRKTMSASKQQIKTSLSDCRLLVVLISSESLKSKWFRLEVMQALELMWETPLDLISVVLEDMEDSRIPKFLQLFEYFDASYALDANSIAKIATKMACSDTGPKTSPDPDRKAEQHRGQPTGKEVKRAMKIIEERLQKIVGHEITPLNEKLSNVINAVSAREHVLSPITIKFREEAANEHVWVLTRYLYNDLFNDEIKDGVNQNLGKGKKYVYFMPKGSKLAWERKKTYDINISQSEYKDQVLFEEIDTDLVLPFEELVIYDPLEAPRTWGYVQYSFQNEKQRIEDLYLRMDKSILTELVDKLKAKHPDVIKWMFGEGNGSSGNTSPRNPKK